MKKKLTPEDRDMIIKHRIGEELLARSPAMDKLLGMLTPDQNVKKVLAGNMIVKMLKAFSQGKKPPGKRISRAPDQE